MDKTRRKNAHSRQEGRISAREFAEREGLSIAHVRRLAQDGKIEGAEIEDGVWRIPEHAEIDAETHKRRKRITPEIESEILKLEAAGDSPEVIKRRLGISRASVYKALKMPAPLEKPLRTLRRYLDAVNAKGEPKANALAYYKKRLKELWEEGPYTRLSEPALRDLSPSEMAALEEYVTELAEKITIELEDLSARQRTPGWPTRTDKAPVSLRLSQAPNRIELSAEWEDGYREGKYKERR